MGRGQRGEGEAPNSSLPASAIFGGPPLVLSDQTPHKTSGCGSIAKMYRDHHRPRSLSGPSQGGSEGPPPPKKNTPTPTQPPRSPRPPHSHLQPSLPSGLTGGPRVPAQTGSPFPGEESALTPGILRCRAPPPRPRSRFPVPASRPGTSPSSGLNQGGLARPSRARGGERGEGEGCLRGMGGTVGGHTPPPPPSSTCWRPGEAESLELKRQALSVGRGHGVEVVVGQQVLTDHGGGGGKEDGRAPSPQICPSSLDVPLPPERLRQRRSWGWEGSGPTHPRRGCEGTSGRWCVWGGVPGGGGGDGTRDPWNAQPVLGV